MAAPGLFALHLVLALTAMDVFADAKLHRRHLYDQYDALFVARCEARCWNLENRNRCTRLCLLKGASKPGRCPNSVQSPFATVCLDICKQDSQCPDVSKCCSHSCGITCQAPEGLELEKDIPDKPIDLIVSERRRRRTIKLKWVPGESPPGPVLFLVQERHHTGQAFMEHRMSDWSSYVRSIKPYAILKRLVKPGRWYQFRVAAVNANGTKGFSENSLRFIASVGPRPPKLPQNVTVGPLFQSNGSLSTELRWKPPNSDLPVDRYKVFWSKRLHGVSALDSVLVHQQTIPKNVCFLSLYLVASCFMLMCNSQKEGTYRWDLNGEPEAFKSPRIPKEFEKGLLRKSLCSNPADCEDEKNSFYNMQVWKRPSMITPTFAVDSTSFRLENLQPNSLYFLQVQALSQYGKERLKGEKSGLVLNTTNYLNVTANFISLDGNQQGRVDGLHLQKVFWDRGELRARVAWKNHHNTKRYALSWWSSSCKKDNPQLTMAATTKASSFDLYELEFGCRYRVSVREVSSEKLKSPIETSINFTTPSCEDFKKRYVELTCGG